MIRIAIVDDHQIFRDGVLLTLSRIEDVEIAGDFQDGEELLKAIKPGNIPDIVLMDIKMPNKNGIDTTAELLKKHPGIKVIAFSMYGDEKYLEKMLEVGAQGYILKNIGRDRLINAIKTIKRGNQYFSEELLPYFMNKYIKNNDKEEVLTDRELEVLKFIAKGMTNDEIAQQLSISAGTVANYKTSLLRKTKSKNIVNLLTYAIRSNLV